MFEKIRKASLDFHLLKYRENPEAFVKNLETEDFILYGEAVKLINLFLENPESFYEREKLKKEFLLLEKNITRQKDCLKKLIVKFENANEIDILKKEFQIIMNRYPDKKSPAISQKDFNFAP